MTTVDPVPMEPSLGSVVRRGAAWTFASTLLMRLGNIALMAVVARLIIPHEFGVFSLALTAYGFISSVAELGIASAVARVDLDIDKIAPTVTTIACISSFTLAGGMAVFAAPLATLLGSPDAVAPIRILAIAVALIGPFAVPGAQLQREFRQDRVFLANVVAFFPDTALLLGLLLAHVDGAIAFAWSRVLGQLTVGVMMCVGVSRLYGPGFARDQLRVLFGFGLPLAGAGLLGSIASNIDYILVGHMVDVAAVGVYTLAFNVSNWATSAIGSMLNTVVLPAFSSVKDDPARVTEGVRRAVRVVSVVAFLICGMTAGLAHPLILVLYGAQWIGAAPVLIVLSVFGAAVVLNLLVANIGIGMGRTGTFFAVQGIMLVVLVPALYVGISRGGVVGAGVAHTVVMLVVTLPVYLRALRATTGTKPRAVLAVIVQPLVAGVVAALVAHVASWVPGPALVRLVVGGVAGVGVYVLLMARDVVGVVGDVRIPPWIARLIAGTDPARSWLVGRPGSGDSTATPETGGSAQASVGLPGGRPR